MSRPCCPEHAGWTTSEQLAAHEDSQTSTELVAGVLLAAVVIVTAGLGGCAWLLWAVMA